MSGSGARMSRVSGFWRISSAKGRGWSHIPEGITWAPVSSTFSGAGISAVMTGAAFLRATNHVRPIFLEVRSFCWRAEKTRVEPT